VKSAFTGELPRLYESWANGGTWVVLENEFNDRNEEEQDRYVPVDTCHYMIDWDQPDQVEDKYTHLNPWQKVFANDFLNSALSHPLFRAFYVPWLSESLTTTNQYWLLKNNALVYQQSPGGKYVRVLPHDHDRVPHMAHPQVEGVKAIAEAKKRREKELAKKQRLALDLSKEELAELEALEEEERDQQNQS
jgi:hypothetical protein